MAVDTRHKQYDQYSEIWERCTLVARGTDAVKNERTRFLPALSSQTTTQYENYLKRAVFFNATKRTLRAVEGLVFRKPPVLEYPAGKERVVEYITEDRRSLEVFAKAVYSRVMATGRYGILVDMGEDELIEPYLTGYPAQDIVNWRTGFINGRVVPTMVVLKEEETLDGDDEFDQKCRSNYRVLRLRKVARENAVVDWVYTQQLYVQVEGADKKKRWEPQEENTPKARGRPFNFIPFFFVSPLDNNTDIEEPPVLDLVDMNLAHYRTSADLEHGRHFTALPTPYISGAQISGDLVLGPYSSYSFTNPQAKMAFMEYEGKGLASLEAALEEKEQKMVILGARLLEQQKAGVEAAETHKLRRLGEDSIVAATAGSVSLALTEALRVFAYWRGDVAALETAAANNIRYELSGDYTDYSLTSQELQALVEAQQKRVISWDTIFHRLQRAGIIDDKRTTEEELELIESSGPENPTGLGLFANMLGKGPGPEALAGPPQDDDDEGDED